MRKTLSAFSILLLGGCGLMPGMQNLNTSHMERAALPPRMKTHPVLIRITPPLLAGQHLSTYYYKVAPSDVLRVTVWEHPEFSIQDTPTGSTATTPGLQGAAGQAVYLVNANGQIYFPLIGYITVAGTTVDDIRNRIAHRLKKYIPNPQVNVRVADYRGQKIYVIGEVKKPGLVPVNDQRISIADALALSGGIDQNYADTKHIYVIRGSIVHPRIYWLNAKTPDRLLLAEHFNLHPNDILYVSSAPTSQWNRMLNQLLPTIEAVWYTKSIATAR